MYELLYRYFITHRKLPLPGIGELVWQQGETVVNYNDRTISPSPYEILLKENGATTLPASFFKWLSGGLETDEHEAEDQFHHFIDNFLTTLRSGEEINWAEIGSFSLSANQDISFKPRRKEFIFEGPVMAEKITTIERAELAASSLSSETEVESKAPLEEADQPVSRKSYLFEIAVAIGILALIFIGWYLSEHGLKSGAAGNQVKMTPKDSSPTYVEP